MTKACQHFKKRAIDFSRLPGIQEYMDALADFLKVEKSHLLISKPGRGGGTLMHPKMAVKLASWLDVRFEVWMHLMIDNILQGNIQTSVAVPTKEAVAVHAVAEELKLENLALKAENKALKERVQHLQEEGYQGDLPDGWKAQGVAVSDTP